MNSSTTPDFWASYGALSSDVKRRVNIAFRIWNKNPNHPSLRFKKVGEFWSVRIGREYRALAMKHGDTYYWFWVGAHDEYLRLING